MKEAKSLIYIDSDLINKIKINNNITIYPISDTEKQEILKKAKITDAIYYFYTDIQDANYCFEVKNDNNTDPSFDLQVINQTLALVSKGSSRNILEIYPQTKEITIDIFSSKTNDILGITKLNKNNINKFKTIFLKRRNSRDLKLLLLINHYITATSGGINKLNNSFIELFTTLEMLYLNENENNKDIRKKLTNRIKNIINQDLSYYYNTRSKLVHTGQRKKNDKEDLSDTEFQNIFLNVAEIVRVSILKYLDNPNVFSEKNLQIICDPKYDKKTKVQICSCDHCITSS